MLAIHAELKAETFPNSRSMAEKLAVSARTIQRDFEYMRDALNLPLAYDETRFGFYYDGIVDTFPSLQISDGDLLALAMAKESLLANQGAPYAGALKIAFEKMTASLADTLNFAPHELAGLFSYRVMGRAPVNEDIFTTLGRAVLDQMTVRFVYKPSPDKPGLTMDVEPYHLASINANWYLVARSCHHSALRTYALTRISELIIRDRSFKRPTDFSPEQYFGESLGPFRGDGVEQIKVHFDSYAANLVRERIWHPTQQIKELPEGGLELTLTIGDSYEALRWILGWGDQAQLLSPPNLVTELTQMLDRMRENYATPA